MLNSSTFQVFSPPRFLKTIALDTPELDRTREAAKKLAALLRGDDLSAALDGELESQAARSPEQIFESLAADRLADLSYLEWLLVFGSGMVWQQIAPERHEAIAARIWRHVSTDEPLVLAALCLLLQSRDRMGAEAESSVFAMPIVLQEAIYNGQASSPRVRDWMRLIQALARGQYLELFAKARERDCLPRALFRQLGLPTQLRGLDRVERAIVDWLMAEPSSQRCEWLLHGLESFWVSQVHAIVSDLLDRVSPQVGSEHTNLRRWLERKYWYRSAEGRIGWEQLSDVAQKALPRWLSIGGWSELKGAIELIKPQLPDWEQNQLKQRPLFWSHYTSRFDRVRILFCRESHGRLTAPQQELFECLEPSKFSEKTELCIFDLRTHYVVEILRGKISEMRIFPQSEELEELFFRSESLSLLQIRQQPCDLDSQVHDHRFLWQGYAERWLRSHGIGIQPNPGIKHWKGLPPDAAKYDPERGLPEPSEDQKRDRDKTLVQWWRKLRELQAKITPAPEPEPEREPAAPKSEPAELIDDTHGL